MRVIEVLIKSQAGLHILRVAGNTKKNILDKIDNTKRTFCSLEGLPNVSHLVAFEITFFARMVFPFESCTPICRILQNISSTFK